jgi:hypothetical protein
MALISNIFIDNLFEAGGFFPWQNREKRVQGNILPTDCTDSA